MAGGKRPPPFANAVDNLGSKTPAISSCSLAREANLVLRAREHRFNRSSTISSSVALAPVEKNGPYHPKKRSRRRVHGFLRRMASRGGARVVQNRRRKGRQRLTP